MSRSLFILGFVALWGGALGCSSSVTCPAQPLTNPEDALASIASARAGWSSLKAEARVTQWADRGRIRGTVLMFFEQPGKVRFDVMSALGPAAVLTSDGENFQLSDLRANTFVQGPTCPDNIARLLGVAIEGENVMRLLTGDTPIIDAASRAMECRNGSYTLLLTGADGTSQEIVVGIDPGDATLAAPSQRLSLVESSVLAPDGTSQWRATWDGYVTVDGVRLPTEVRLIDYVNGADTEVRVKSFDVNPDVPAAAFQQLPRPGMATEVASCAE